MTSAAEHLLVEAFNHHQTGNVARAEQLYRSVLAIDSANLNALQLLGVLNHQGGKHAEAVELLQRAVAILEQGGDRAAQHAVLYNNFGNALRAVGKGAEALSQYRQGIALDPTLVALHANLADGLLAQGDFAGAIVSYEVAQGCAPLSTQHLCHLGTAYALAKRFHDAEIAYRNAVAPFVNAAMAQRADEKAPPVSFESGVSASCGASDPFPPTSSDMPIAADTLTTKLQPYSAVMAAIPAAPDLYYLLARALRDSGDVQAAIETFRMGLQLDSDHTASLYELGVSLVKVGFARLAIPFLERAAELKPDFASFHVELGNALYFVEQKDRAVQCHRRAFELQPLRTWRARTNPAEFSVLAIEASGAANTPAHFLLCNTSFECNFFALFKDVAPDHDLLRRHGDVVINLISDVDQGQHILPAAGDLIDRLGKPVINHPLKIAKTDRHSIAERLVGIPFCRGPKTVRRERDILAAAGGITMLSKMGFVYPLLLRVAGSHGGDAFEKVDRPGDIADFLKQYPAAEYYVSEFIDYRSRDGFYRKYRFIYVNDEILPYHLAIGDSWKVHHFRTDMSHQMWMQEEEKAFLEDPWRVFANPHHSALREIQALVGLEFFGVDCGLDREGNIVIFEVNASMLVHDDNADFPYKTPHCKRIKDALRAMLAQAADRKAKEAA